MDPSLNLTRLPVYLIIFVLAGCESAPDPYLTYLENSIEIAQLNIAHADTYANASGENDPYRRRMVYWCDEDQNWRVEEDAVFRLKYDPLNPLADEDGFVRYPNIDVLLEQLDIQIAKERLSRYRNR